MSDGPHRSLPMHRGWKHVAERAANTSHDVGDVTSYVAPALEQDCRNQMSHEFLAALTALVQDRGQLRFPTDLNGDLNSLRPLASSSAERMVIDNIEMLSACDTVSLDVIRESLEATLRGGGACAARHIEEHWLRSSKREDTPVVRARLDLALERVPYRQIADKLLGLDATPLERPTRYVGLDDGARL